MRLYNLALKKLRKMEVVGRSEYPHLTVCDNGDVYMYEYSTVYPEKFPSLLKETQVS